MDFDGVLTEREACQIIKLAPTTLAHWRMTGKGPPFYKLGRSVRYPRRELINWLEARLVPNKSNESGSTDRHAA
jgi:predicted DNA-binding transcriptional regulator AlpA